jgi:hypothetical protein
VKNNITQIHEVEWILKATANHIEPTSDNGLPSENVTGMYDKPLSFISGYGVIDVQKAVSVALTLEELRKTDDSATVQDAIDSYMRVVSTRNVQENTNVLTTAWRGEWSQYLTPIPSVYFEVNQSRLVRAPENASKMILGLQYTAVDSVEFEVIDLTFSIDYDRDGSADYTGSFSPDPNGQKHLEMDIESGDFSSHRGEYWYFTVEGRGIGRPFSQLHKEPEEVRGEYAYSVSFVFNLAEGDVEHADPGGYHSGIGRLEFGDRMGYEGGSISMTQGTFDLNRIGDVQEPKKAVTETDLGWLIFLIIAGTAIFIGFIIYKILRLNMRT